jgi:hypothetical protein
MKSRIAEFIINKRLFILIAIILITLFFGYGLSKLKIETRIYDLFPNNHPYIKIHRKFQKTFGGANTIMVEVRVKRGDIFNKETLSKIKKITDDIRFYPDVIITRVLSISQRKIKNITASAEGINVVPLMEKVPKTDKEMNNLIEAIFSNEMYKGFFVSSDGKAALIMAEFKEEMKDYNALFKFLRGLVERESDNNTKISVAGEPMLRGWIANYTKQTLILFIATFLIVVIFIFSNIKEFYGLLIPILSVVISTIWGLGLMGWSNINLDPLIFIIPFLIISRIISHSVQMMKRYFEEYYKSGDVKEACKSTIEGLIVPGFAAIVTDAAGLLILLVVPIPLLQRMGIFLGIWLANVFIIDIFFNPVLISYLPPSKKKVIESGGKTGILEKILLPVSKIVTTKEGSIGIIGAIVIIVIIGSIYASRLTIGDVHPGSPILWPDSIYNKDVDSINEKFPGANPYYVIVEGKKPEAIKSPYTLRNIESFERFLTKRAVAGGSQSLVSIVKKLNEQVHEGDPKWGIIPKTKREIGFLFFFYQSKGDPGDFDIYTSKGYKDANIIIFYKDHKGDTIRNAINDSKRFIKNISLKNAAFRLAGGIIGVFAAVNEEVEIAQITTLILAFLAVLIFCSISFRTIVGSIYLAISLAVANLSAFAYMAYMNIGLDVNTLPVSSIGIGVGVDYAIYIMARIQEEYRLCKDLKEAIKKGMGTAGEAVFLTAIAISGSILIWYFFSDLRFTAEMGLLLAILLFFNMIGAVTLIPSIIYLAKPKFIIKG